MGVEGVEWGVTPPVVGRKEGCQTEVLRDLQLVICFLWKLTFKTKETTSSPLLQCTLDSNQGISFAYRGV